MGKYRDHIKASKRKVVLDEATFLMANKNAIDGLLFAQIEYWFDGRVRLVKKRKSEDKKSYGSPEPCLAKRRYEWERECFVTARQVDRSLKRLKALGLIDTAVYDFDGKPTIHIFENEHAIDEAYEVALQEIELMDNCNSPNGKNPNQEGVGNPENEGTNSPFGELQFTKLVNSLTDTTMEDSCESPSDPVASPIGLSTDIKPKERKKEREKHEPQNPSEFLRAYLTGSYIGSNFKQEVEEAKAIYSSFEKFNRAGKPIFSSIYDEIEKKAEWEGKGIRDHQKAFCCTVLIGLTEAMQSQPNGYSFAESAYRIKELVQAEAKFYSMKKNDTPSKVLKTLAAKIYNEIQDPLLYPRYAGTPPWKEYE